MNFSSSVFSTVAIKLSLNISCFMSSKSMITFKETISKLFRITFWILYNVFNI